MGEAASGNGGAQGFDSSLVAEEVVEVDGEYGYGIHGAELLFEHILRWTVELLESIWLSLFDTNRL